MKLRTKYQILVVYWLQLFLIQINTNKIPDYAKYITTPEFNKLAAEKFTSRIKQANLVTKTDFDKKLTHFNKQITSNETIYLEVQKKLNSLITLWYFRIKKKTMVMIMFLVGTK